MAARTAMGGLFNETFGISWCEDLGFLESRALMEFSSSSSLE